MARLAHRGGGPQAGDRLTRPITRRRAGRAQLGGRRELAHVTAARRLAALAMAIAGIVIPVVPMAGCASRAESQPAADGGSGSTLRSTWTDPRGNGVLRPGKPEPLRPRTELAAAAPLGAELARFAQLTDAHVADEESPARPVPLDRLGAPFNSPFRPQEALAGQVLAGAVRAVNAWHPQALVVSGDTADNVQANELAEAATVLRGGRADPDSGDRGYDGPQAAAGADPLFYRADVDAPLHPGLVERAQRPFPSPGLRAPSGSCPRALGSRCRPGCWTPGATGPWRTRRVSSPTSTSRAAGPRGSQVARRTAT